MQNAISKLFSSGSYSLPFLIHLHGSYKQNDEYHEIDMRFINDTKSIVYKGDEYTAESFSYTPNASEYGMTGGGTLEISVIGNKIINLVELCNDITCEVVGVLLDNGTIEELQAFKHHNGTITVDRAKAKFTFKHDERLDMSFPALIWNNQNNRGNG